MKLTATHGNVLVTTTLYGVITPERIAREQTNANHRAEQLDVPVKSHR